MKRVFLFTALVILFVTPLSHGQRRVEDVRSRSQGPTPIPAVAEFVTRLPADLPPRATGFAFDGKKFWAMIYHGRGRYATLDPVSLEWEKGETELHASAIREVAGAFQSPGGVCFAGGKLWVGGSYGESFGAINLQDWKVERLFKGKVREDRGSQSYSSMVHDGSHLWIAWHWNNYVLPASQTQQLLKIDPETGKVIERFPAPAGTKPDSTHGLTWDGTKLWHMKDSKLSAIDPSSGNITTQYIVDQIKRPSGLAWDGRALWIIEFGGDVWRVRI